MKEQDVYALYRQGYIERVKKGYYGLSAARRGETEICIDCDDLTDDEAEYLQREVKRRIKRENY